MHLIYLSNYRFSYQLTWLYSRKKTITIGDVQSLSLTIYQMKKYKSLVPLNDHKTFLGSSQVPCLPWRAVVDTLLELALHLSWMLFHLTSDQTLEPCKPIVGKASFSISASCACCILFLFSHGLPQLVSWRSQECF